MPWPANSDEFFNKPLTVYSMTNPQTPAPALDEEREKLASWLEKLADDYDGLYPPNFSIQLYRAVTLLRQPATAVAPVAVDDWLPISTAPKDGTEILASDFDAIDIVSWQNPPKVTPKWVNRDGQFMHPSYWQPLPDHPPLPIPQRPQGEEAADA